MHSIAVAGHLCLDITPRHGSTAVLEPGRLFEVGPLAISLGGSVANTGRALVDLGATVTPFASIGDDEFDGTRVDVQGTDLLHVGYPPLLPGLLVDGGHPLHTLLRRAHAAGATTSLDLVVVDPDSAVGALDWAGILARVLAECDVASPSLDRPHFCVAH